MSKSADFILEQVELIEKEFKNIDSDKLFNMVWDKIIKIGTEAYRKMNDVDKFDYLVDGILMDLNTNWRKR